MVNTDFLAKILSIVKDADLRLQITDLFGENLKLKEENSELKKKLEVSERAKEIQSKLTFENNHYYLPTPKGEKEGPFCTNCWDSNQKLLRLHQTGKDGEVTFFTCPNCRTNTQVGKYARPSWHNKAVSF